MLWSGGERENWPFNLTNNFLISKGVTQYKLVASLGATETYPFIGSSEMIRKMENTPAQLRKQVTSPGGTTERALNVFNKGNLESTLREAMHKAYERAEEMSEDFSV